LQPSEFGKVVAILVVAALLGAERGERDGLPWKRVAMCTAAVLVPAVLIARQPDLGTTMALPFILVAMLFAGGLSLRQMGIIVGGGLVAVFAAIRLGFLAEHQMQRIRAFIDPELSTPDALFQLNQSKLAIGSGQMFGKGLFNGAPTAVPDQQNDFIFSVIGEQFGFVGGILVLGVFLVIVWRLLIIAAQARDTFGQMAAVGIAATVAFHVFVNIGMTIGMAPVTGLPLPFVSQGGSFYLAMAIAVGIANSIWLRRSPIPGETYIV
jgi:rod shape determining protein RodA